MDGVNPTGGPQYPEPVDMGEQLLLAQLTFDKVDGQLETQIKNPSRLDRAKAALKSHQKLAAYSALIVSGGTPVAIFKLGSWALNKSGRGWHLLGHGLRSLGVLTGAALTVCNALFLAGMAVPALIFILGGSLVGVFVGFQLTTQWMVSKMAEYLKSPIDIDDAKSKIEEFKKFLNEKHSYETSSPDKGNIQDSLSDKFGKNRDIPKIDKPKL